MTRRIRLGIIGTGIAAHDLHWPPLQRLQQQFEIVALCNRTPGKAEEFGRFIGANPRITSDYHELLSWQDVEAVDIAVPIALNAQTALDALRAGKHVIVEKPIAAGAEEGRMMLREAAKYPNQVLLVAENVRYEPRFRKARELVQQGHIGQPRMLHADILVAQLPGNKYAETAWRKQPEHLGGFLSDGGVHHTAGLQMIAGKVTAVQGMITTLRPDIDPTDTLLANLEFESGAVGHLTVSFGMLRREPESAPFRVFGSAGSMDIHQDRIALFTSKGEDTIPIPEIPNGFDGEFLDFYRSVVDHKQPEVHPEDTLHDLLVIDAVFQSSRERRTIEIDAG